jgi:hypothetical protein
MGALMVVDPQHTARYQPVGLYINRGAPKKGRLVRGRKTKNPRENTYGKTTRGEEKATNGREQETQRRKKPRSGGNKRKKTES